MIAVCVCHSLTSIYVRISFWLTGTKKALTFHNFKNSLIVLADSLQLLYTKIQNKVGKNVVISYTPLQITPTT